MLDKILLLIFPYLAVIIALAVSLNRFKKNQFTFSSLSSDFLQTKELYEGAIPWHFGVLTLLFGHLLVLLFPGQFLAFNASALRLYILEGTGLIIGILSLIGLFQVMRKSFTKQKRAGQWNHLNNLGLVLIFLQILNGVVIALNYRWLSSWYAALIIPYLHTLIKLHPDLSYVASMPLLVKLQIINTHLILVLIPFTQFMRIVLLVVAYPVRGIQLVTGHGWTLEKVKVESQKNKKELIKAGVTFGVLFALIMSVVVITEARKIGFSQGYMPAQPIKFSHKTHAGDNQIQCLYCHFAAQSGRHAGVPPTELCMNCHTHVKKDAPEIQKIVQSIKSGDGIRWNKVNHYPDFAYFNHSQHVMIGKVACQKCHGEVQTFVVMKQQENLSMGMCINCHREKEIAAPANHKSSAGGDCAKCHY